MNAHNWMRHVKGLYKNGGRGQCNVHRTDFDLYQATLIRAWKEIEQSCRVKIPELLGGKSKVINANAICLTLFVILQVLMPLLLRTM